MIVEMRKDRVLLLWRHLQRSVFMGWRHIRWETLCPYRRSPLRKWIYVSTALIDLRHGGAEPQQTSHQACVSLLLVIRMVQNNVLKMLIQGALKPVIAFAFMVRAGSETASFPNCLETCLRPMA